MCGKSGWKDNSNNKFRGARCMFLRRKAHSLRRNQEAQNAYFEAQGAHVELIKLRGKEHRNG